jgi:ATP-binding cassette subfamily B protein
MIQKLLRLLGGHRTAMAVVCVFAVGSTIFGIIGPKLSGMATTALYNGITSKIAGTGGVDFAWLGKIVFLMACLYICSAVFSITQGWVMAGVSAKVSYGLRKSIVEKINCAPFSYFESETTGETLSTITNDVDTVTTNLNACTVQIITSIVKIIGVLVMMLTISPLMTLIAFVLVPLSGILMKLVMSKGQRHFKNQQDNLAVIDSQAEEMISGLQTVQISNYQKKAISAFRDANDKLYASAWKSQFISALMQPLISIVSNLGFIGVSVAGGALAFRQMISVGDIQAFIQYVNAFNTPVSNLAQSAGMMQALSAASGRVFEFLGAVGRVVDFLEAEERAGEEKDKPLTGDAEYQVRFDHIKFGYNPQKAVIHDFSCAVRSGQTIAIVGPTGAGKTTIVKLLERFYDVQGGGILLGGVDIRNMPRHELRGAIAMVLQDTWLFAGTIMDNIRYGRLDASDEEVVQAAELAYCAGFIAEQPGGFGFLLDDNGSNISQGQKQLLTIARAVLADRPILILDEATSNVDTRTEILIQKAMKKLMAGRTSFVIAHRLSTIRNADTILVLKDGDVIEQGTHTALLEKNGFYAGLYNSQFEG